MRRLLAAMVAGLALGAAAEAHAYEMRPGWGYATIDDNPFNEPSGASLPATQAFPRGTIKDVGTPDGWAVRLTVYAFNASGGKLAEYTTTERHAVYTAFDRRIDVNPNQIAYLRYDFCRADNVCAPSHRIGRPAPPLGSPGSPTPPAPAPDADRDGVPAGVDCDDTNSTIWPGASEVPGNGRDDDCADGDQPGRVVATIVNRWRASATGARVTRLAVQDAPATATVTVRCLGKRCRVKASSVAVTAKGSASLTRLVRRKLRPGSVLEVRVTAPNMIGKVVRYRVRRRAVPHGRRLCLPPGVAEPGKC